MTDSAVFAPRLETLIDGVVARRIRDVARAITIVENGGKIGRAHV